MVKKKCCCDGGSGKKREYNFPDEGDLTLDELPVGMQGVVVRILPELRERKKFADIGLVPGAELQMEAHAPFGGLLRIKILETSMALHRDDAAKIVLKKK